MQTYAEFSPTEFDTAGLGLPDRQHWLVAPCGRNRDSGSIEESNFAAVLKSIGGESDTVEVHGFGHWSCGWFEIILIDPSDEEAVRQAELAELRLEDESILDEDDLEEREWEAACEAWEALSVRERGEILQRHNLSVFAARRAEIPCGLPDYDDFFWR